MISVSIKDNYGFQLDDPNVLNGANLLIICAEILDERFRDTEVRERLNFGLTMLGGLTASLDYNKMRSVLAFNFKVEENNEVGLCVPYNLVIAPRKFFTNIFSNIYDEFTHKCVRDIVEANEKYQKCESIYVELKNGFGITDNSEFLSTWISQDIIQDSLNNLTNSFKINSFTFTKNVYLIA